MSETDWSKRFPEKETEGFIEELKKGLEGLGTGKAQSVRKSSLFQITIESAAQTGNMQPQNVGTKSREVTEEPTLTPHVQSEPPSEGKASPPKDKPLTGTQRLLATARDRSLSLDVRRDAACELAKKTPNSDPNDIIYSRQKRAHGLMEKLNIIHTSVSGLDQQYEVAQDLAGLIFEAEEKRGRFPHENPICVDAMIELWRLKVVEACERYLDNEGNSKPIKVKQIKFDRSHKRVPDKVRPAVLNKRWIELRDRVQQGSGGI